MPKMIGVKPVDGRTFPMEGSGFGANRRVINAPRRVVSSVYYRNAVRHGDLAEATDAEIDGIAQPSAAADAAASAAASEQPGSISADDAHEAAQ